MNYCTREIEMGVKGCPIERAVSVLDGKWTLLILFMLSTQKIQQKLLLVFPLKALTLLSSANANRLRRYQIAPCS